jgi:hypothetical protein
MKFNFFFQKVKRDFKNGQKKCPKLKTRFKNRRKKKKFHLSPTSCKRFFHFEKSVTIKNFLENSANLGIFSISILY